MTFAKKIRWKRIGIFLTVAALLFGALMFAAWLPSASAVSQEELEARITRLWQEISEDSRSTGKKYGERFGILLGKLMPRELTAGFLHCNQGTDHKTLARKLKDWKMDIAGYVGYERCVITAGGIDTSAIIPGTMECRKIRGLYFAGEILDLDGDTGGYNLHIAFSTGYLAGQSAAKSCPIRKHS